MRFRRLSTANVRPPSNDAPLSEKTRTDLLGELLTNNRVPAEWNKMFPSIVEAFNYSFTLPLSDREAMGEDIYGYAGQVGKMPRAVVHHLMDRALGVRQDSSELGGPIHKALDKAEQKNKGE